MRKTAVRFGILLLLVLLFFVRGGTRAPRSYIGTLGQMGLLVERVFADSPAHRAGLRPGDIILSVNGTALDSRERYQGMVTDAEPGTELELRILRYNLERRGFEAGQITLTTMPYGGGGSP